VTKSKAKGTRAESECVKYLREKFAAVERRTLSGSKDKGDIAGIPNCVGEIKAQVKQELTKWYRETLTEMVNADAANCFLVVKVPYKSVAKWDFWVPAYQVGLEEVSDPMEARWLRMDFELGRDVLRRLTDLTYFL
jgi:Holliday junction resolvase